MKLLKFSSKTCQPCKQITLLLNQIGVAHEDIVLENHKDLFIEHNVRKVPTLILLDEYKEVDRLTGLPTLQILKTFLRSNHV